MLSPVAQAPAAAAEQFATAVSSMAQASREQIQLPLSRERQHFWASVGGGHSATGVPRVSDARESLVPHWQTCAAGSDRQL